MSSLMWYITEHLVRAAIYFYLADLSCFESRLFS